MAARKAKRSAKRSARVRKVGNRITIEFPGARPAPMQEDEIRKTIIGLVELAVLALSQGVSITRQCNTKRRR